MKNNHNWTIFIDGASRNNPGLAGIGIVMQKDEEYVAHEAYFIGTKTNNQAEYLALLFALYLIRQYAHASDTVYICSDSELLVKQFQGLYRIKNEGLKPLAVLAQQLAQPYTIHLAHIVRSENKEADALANKGIDFKIPLPNDFLNLLQKHHITL